MGGVAVEIISRRERRRRWSVEDKLRIVSETEETGARVTDVAARHDVYPGLLFTWRRQVRNGQLLTPPAARFMPVRMLTSAAAAEVGHSINDRHNTSAAEAPSPTETIEIILANGCRLRFGQHIDARALRRIVGVLRG